MKNRRKPPVTPATKSPANAARDPAADGLSRPESATHPLVALGGLVAFFAGIAALSQIRPFQTVAYDALTLILFVALGVFVPDMLWRRVWRNPSAGLMRSPPDPSWDRTITKFAGFAGSLGFIAFLYWLFPEYSTKSPFYQHFWTLLRVAIPAVLVIALPYIYLVDGRMQNPHDGLWQFGRVLTFQWSDVDGRTVGQHLLGWLIKGFFLPLMFGYMCADLVRLYQYDLGKIVTFREFYEFLYYFLFFVDVSFGTMGYIMSLKLTDTHIRSSEPTMLGWVVAIVCYEPFWNLVGRQYLHYGGSVSWTGWLAGEPLLQVLWGSSILLLTGVYVWATVIFGGRFSNLTHRGIITSGPFRYTKHPAYISKSLTWWLVSVPFVIDESLSTTLRHCVLLLMVNGIYYLRAKTEERHLSRDPVYIEYSRWIDSHGIFRRVARVPLIGRLARLQLPGSQLPGSIGR